MASLNKVQIIGNLGRDPEIRYLPSGGAVADISVATTATWKDKDGEKKEHTEWHRCTFFGKLAEVVGEYLKKGAQVYVEGRLQTEKWQDKEGNDRYTTKIMADRMLMLGGKPREDGAAADKPEPRQKRDAPKDKPAAKGGASFDDMDDDIPF